VGFCRSIRQAGGEVPRPARDGSAASHLEGLNLFMQLDHLLPLVPEMLPQRPLNGNQPSVGACRCRCVSRFRRRLPLGTGTHPHPTSPAVSLPRQALTPGVVLTTSRARVCMSGYASSVRDVTESDKAAVYARYGVVWVPYQHEVDHLISLELGGSNAIRNLWPEPYAGSWGARTKDVLENRLHELVCEGRLTLRSAQRREAADWVA